MVLASLGFVWTIEQCFTAVGQVYIDDGIYLGKIYICMLCVDILDRNIRTLSPLAVGSAQAAVYTYMCTIDLSKRTS